MTLPRLLLLSVALLLAAGKPVSAADTKERRPASAAGWLTAEDFEPRPAPGNRQVVHLSRGHVLKQIREVMLEQFLPGHRFKGGAPTAISRTRVLGWSPVQVYRPGSVLPRRGYEIVTCNTLTLENGDKVRMENKWRVFTEKKTGRQLTPAAVRVGRPVITKWSRGD